MRLFLVLLSATGFGWAQQSGEIRIEVKDPSGTPMRVSGTLEGAAGGATRNFRTDEQGRYSFANLPLGRYRLQTARTGFAAYTEFIDVMGSEPVSRTITMSLSAAAFQIDVVETTPLAGTGLSVDQVAAPTQTASAADIQSSGALDLSDLLNRRLSGVNVNANAGNPFEADVNYRGYTASPLLGTPEGVSVYMDGVRQNQPFGDTVNWDLIPKVAIQETTLVPGSNPVFGLNTLGGAVSIETKDGRTAPGVSLEVNGGSYGRRAVSLEYGGSRRAWNWYFGGTLFHEDGWRVASPSDVKQAFAKLGWAGGGTALSLSGGYADNVLNGNALQEQRFLTQSYSSVYTIPDISHNRAPYLTLSARHSFRPDLTLSGNAYFRYLRGDSTSADLNVDSFDENVYTLSAADQAALRSAGYTGFPTGILNASNTPFPFWRCIAQALQHADPSERCDASQTRGFAKQHNYGFTQQVLWNTSPHGHKNQFIAGIAEDFSSLTFQQSTQFAYANPDRTVTLVPAFADGSTSANGVPVDTRVNLHGVPWTLGFYATDTLTLGKWNLNVAGRFNRTRIDNTDRLSAVEGVRGSLNGSYLFKRFNPSVGVTYSPIAAVNLYASYSESSRAPTSIELGCADPNDPCNLPNALLSDPPLKQVVTHTAEAGVRSAQERGLRWSLGWYWAENHDDLLFVASPQTGFGYFKNFGQTRRQGLETSLSRRFGRVTVGGNYTFVDATYQSAETINGSSNSANDAGVPGFDGDIQIAPGDRIPLVPRHIGKAFADYQITSKLAADVNFQAVSSSYARGNENNLSRPDGVYYLGPGTSPGYGVTDVSARYQIHRRVQLSVDVDNLFNHHYYTAAQLGPTPFTSAGTIAIRALPAVNGNFPVVHSTFYAPGAPIGAWGSVKVSF